MARFSIREVGHFLCCCNLHSRVAKKNGVDLKVHAV